MYLVPNFEIGVWNAWIFVIILYAAVFIPLGIYSKKVEKRMEGEPSGDEQKKSDQDRKCNHACNYHAPDLDPRIIRADRVKHLVILCRTNHLSSGIGYGSFV